MAPAEQLFVYLLNRARHDPVAYQHEANIPVDLSYVTPRAPLAVNDQLFKSAQFHATEMTTLNYFGHTSPTGKQPNKMVRDQGYPLPYSFTVNGTTYLQPDDSNQVESIAGMFGNGVYAADSALAGLITDAGVNPPGHRIHLLGIDAYNADNREIGVGYSYSAASNPSNAYAVHATRVSPNDIFLTGVVFNDANANLRYDLNEGLSGVTIQAGGLSTTTNAAGGWSIKVPAAGTYTVTASGGAFADTATASVTASQNMEVDFLSGFTTASINFAPPPPDTTPPTVTISRVGSSPLKIGSLETITFTLSEKSTNFLGSDVSATGGTLSNFAGSGTSYTATFTPNAAFTGTATVTVAAGAFTDKAGNNNTAGSLSIPVDTVAPTMTIARVGSGTLKIGSTDTVTFTLSEPSTTFAAGDATATGGTLTNFAGSGTSYTATFTPNAAFTGSAVIKVAAATFTDAVGNPNAAVASLSIPVDTVPPTVTIARVGSGTLKIGSTDTVIFTLSESSTNFTMSDITSTGGTLTNFTGSGTSYSATFTPATTFQGMATVAVTVAAFTDASGNPNAAVSLGVPVDTVPPTVVITRSGSGTMKIGSVDTITFTLSEPSTTFAAGDVTYTGGTLANFSGFGSTYTASFTPTPNFEGTAGLSVAAGAFMDLAGNANPSGAAVTIPVDTHPPTVIITWSGNSPLLAGETATVTFTLSEPSTTFTMSDATVTNGSLADFSGSGTVYTAKFKPAWQFLGAGTITVVGGAFADPAGNGNLAGNTVSIPIDTIAPYILSFSASVTSALLRIGGSVTLTATFSEPLTGPGDVTVRLNSGASVALSLDPGGTSATGVYTVQPGEVAADLDVVAIVPNATLVGTVGSAAGRTIDPTLPSPNLADTHDIVVDGAVKLQDPGGGFSVNPMLVRDLGAVQRIPLRFTTPVNGVNLESFRLWVNNSAWPLQTARLEGSGDTYTLILPISRVRPYGIYRLEIAPAATIRATSNGALVSNETSLLWGRGQSVGMVPDAPVGLTALQSAPVRGKITAALTWLTPAGNGGGAVTEYYVDYRIVGTLTWLRVRTRIPATQNGISIQGLVAGRNYEFRVAARNPSGIGRYATAQLFTTRAV